MLCVLPVATSRQRVLTTASPSLRFADAQLLGAQREVLGRVERRSSHQQPTVTPLARALGTYSTRRLLRSMFRYSGLGVGRILTKNFCKPSVADFLRPYQLFCAKTFFIPSLAALFIKSIPD